jgi:hypothetical protein
MTVALLKYMGCYISCIYLVLVIYFIYLRKATTSLAYVSQLTRKFESLDVSQRYGPPQPVTSLTLPYLQVIISLFLQSRFAFTSLLLISLFFFYFLFLYDRLCGLVVRVLGYRSGGPGSIPGTTRKKSSGSETGSTQPREYK